MPLILNELGTLLKMYAHTHTYLPTYIHTYIHTFAYIPKHTGMRAAARWSNIWISTSTRTHKTKPNQVKKWVKIFNNSYEKIRRKRSPLLLCGPWNAQMDCANIRRKSRTPFTPCMFWILCSSCFSQFRLPLADLFGCFFLSLRFQLHR